MLVAIEMLFRNFERPVSMDFSQRFRRLAVAVMMVVVGLSVSACESRGELHILRDDTYTVEMTVSAPKTGLQNLNCDELKKSFSEAGGESAGHIDDLSTEKEARCHIVISEPQPISSAKAPFPTIVRSSGKYTVKLAPGLIKREIISPQTSILWEVTFPGKVMDVSKSNGGKIVGNGDTVRWTDPRILYEGFQVEGAAAVYTVKTAARAIRDFVIGFALFLVLFALLRTPEASRLERRILVFIDRVAVGLKRRWVKFLKSLSPKSRRRLVSFGYAWRGMVAWVRRPFRRRARRKRRRQREEWLRKQQQSPWTEEDQVLTGQIPIYRVKTPDEVSTTADSQATDSRTPDSLIYEASTPVDSRVSDSEAAVDSTAADETLAGESVVVEPQEETEPSEIAAGTTTEVPVESTEEPTEVESAPETESPAEAEEVASASENAGETEDAEQASAEAETPTKDPLHDADAAKERILDAYNEMLDTGSTIPIPDWNKLTERWGK